MTRRPNVHLFVEREKRKWTQQDLADHLGSNRVTVSRWEQGYSMPDKYFQARLCQLFEKTREQLGFVIATENEIPISPTTLLDPLIPLPSPYLLGREGELQTLKQYLQPGTSVTLHGLPGVGKTTLVAALTHDKEVQERFQGILWANLGSEPQVEYHLTRWGKLLGVPLPDDLTMGHEDDWALSIRTIIGNQRFLIILDDGWSFEDFMALKVGGVQCSYIMTTRYPFIAAQMTSETLAISELSEEASTALLHTLAPKIELDESERLTHLVHTIGGLPLALTLIGNYLRAQSYSGQRHRIRSALDRLNDMQVRLTLSEPRSPLERQSSNPQARRVSLEAIIMMSDQYLSQPVQETFYALSIFPAKPHGFSEEAALTVAKCPLENLYALVDAGLIEISEDRYYLHQLIADYARLRLEATDVFLSVQERLVHYVNTILHAPDYIEKISAFSALLFSALEITYQRENKVAFLQMLASMYTFLRFQVKRTTALLWLSRGLEVPVNSPDEELAHVRIGRAIAIFELEARNFARTRYLLQEGLATASKLESHLLMGELLVALAYLESQEAHYQQANQHLQEGYAQALLSQSQTLQSDILMERVRQSMVQGNLVEARKALEKVQVLVTAPESKLQRRQMLSMTYEYQGVLAFFLDHDFVAAEQHYREALALAQQLQSNRRCADLNGLGIAQAAQGKLQEAEQTFQEALVLSQQIEEHDGQCTALLNLANLSNEQGNQDAMISYLKQAVETARRFGLLQYIQQSDQFYKASVSPDRRHEHKDFDAWFEQIMDGETPESFPDTASITTIQ